LPARKKGTKAATGGVKSGSVMFRALSFSYMRKSFILAAGLLDVAPALY